MTAPTVDTAMTVAIYQDVDGWHWRCHTGLDEIVIASGEPYKRRSEAERICNLIFGMNPVQLAIKGAAGRTVRSYRLR